MPQLRSDAPNIPRYHAAMAQPVPGGYRFDPADPRAPSEVEWERMSPEERARVVGMLPAQPTLDALPPEGDTHSKATATARSTLDSFFRRIGRKIYVSSNLAVYYPGERCFAPDVIAVRDVEARDRERWVAADEGKGIDLAIEVHVSGDRKKDEVENVDFYARLGIEEYFFFDRNRLLLRGYRLAPAEPGRGAKRRAYRPILPQEGRLASEVLGLDLMLEGDKLRFLFGMAVIPEVDELIAKLGSALGQALEAKEQAEQRALAEAERAAALERELAELRAENERLRSQR